MDAWIKCNALPSGFDSDSDSAGRWGGIDDVNGSGDGDAGDAAKAISDGLRHIGAALDGVHLPKQRKRLRVETTLDTSVGGLREPASAREPLSAIAKGMPVVEEVKVRKRRPKGEGDGRRRRRKKDGEDEGKEGKGRGVLVEELMKGQGLGGAEVGSEMSVEGSVGGEE